MKIFVLPWKNSRNLASEAAVFLVRAYQVTLSPDHGVIGSLMPYHCRYFPTCSEYMVQSIRQYGLVVGAMVSLRRVMRCCPWVRGGHDPVPPKAMKGLRN